MWRILAGLEWVAGYQSALVCTLGPLMPGLLLVPLCCLLCAQLQWKKALLDFVELTCWGQKESSQERFGGNHTPIQEFGQNLWLEYNIVIYLPYPLCKNEFQNRCLEKSSPVFLSFPWPPRTVSLQTNLYFKGTALGNAEDVPINQNRKWLDGVMVVWTHKTWLEKSWS